MSRLTAWDWWVVLCFTYMVAGFGALGWVTFHPEDANIYAFLATLACFAWALGGLVYAERDDSWLTRL